MKRPGMFIVGANGQLGRALCEQYPDAAFADIDELDITDKGSVLDFDWSTTDVIVNAAAFTDVDGAELAGKRAAAWKVNATAVSHLATAAIQNNLTLVHISSDYVFDGRQEKHEESEDLSPLSVYGSSKAAGDVAASLVSQHYIFRTSWVIGEGKNFIKTMLDLATRGVSPQVVNDQVGRLTFTSELVRVIDHAITHEIPFGTYNLTNAGRAASWCEIAREVFRLVGRDPSDVSGVSTEDYYASKPNIAQRPLNSLLSLEKIEQTGFKPRDWQEDLELYIRKEQQ